jgi:hypothetical protein
MGKIERSDLDAQKKPCCEGYYAVTPRNELILIPPTGDIDESKGYRWATQADVDVGKARVAALEEIVIPPQLPVLAP